MKNIDEILAVFSDGKCGENLEYSPEFLALEQLVQGRPEQQFGDTIIEAQAPEWHQVEKTALAITQSSCDLRVLARLTWAWASQRGLIGYAHGLHLIEQALTQYWQQIHPVLVEDDFEDPMPRMNALIALGDMQGLGKTIRASSLINNVHGQLSLRDAEAILDGTRGDDFPGGRARLCEVLTQARRSQEPEVMAVFAAAQSLQAIATKVSTELGHEWMPDFSAVLHSLEAIMNVAESSPEEAESADEQVVEQDTSLASESADEGVDSQVASKAFTNWRDVQIKTRNDAMLALEKACSYFEVYEPSHPAPFLLKRVQQTIPLNFYEILQNLTPNGAEQFDTWMPRDQD